MFDIGGAPLRILHFDMECRPLSYLGSDYTTGEPTAIAWAWADQPKEPTVYALTKDEDSAPDMLLAFLRVYDLADVVTGHYIRGFDLPVINGALFDLGLPALGPKMTSDTKLDFLKAKYISESQENLSAALGLDEEKVHMNQERWRVANRLTDYGIALTKTRVVGDVVQHIALRKALIEEGWLGPAKLWTPGPGGAAAKYRP